MDNAQPTELASRLINITEDIGIELVDCIEIDGRPPVFSSVPSNIYPELHKSLAKKFPSGLYSHQAAAIETVLDGNDVCLATPTASGKSLVFMTVVADTLKRNPEYRAIALYPSKALIQDQLNKWKSLLAPIGLDPGYIDGGVKVENRLSIIERHRIVIMTPDVTHAWLMSNLGNAPVSRFLTNLQILVLDEAHVYDGVFGTNMAYFLRRLQAIAPIKTIISSTATIGKPADFIEELTGRRPLVLGGSDDGSPKPPKTILLGRPTGGKNFERIVELLLQLSKENLGRFLAFGDSRKMVEQIVAAARRKSADGRENDEEDGIEEIIPKGTIDIPFPEILPYRAGYEEEDRLAIQKALENGKLSGVVSTSALELGLDIGEIDIVVLVSTPPTVKAFWQRMGRAGRQNPGVCLLLDEKGTICNTKSGLRGYLEKPPEPGWLYLQNEYLQYANALCAAVEAGSMPSTEEPFTSLPKAFLRLFHNEISPTEIIPTELYPLKQRAQAGPHYEFPLRSGIEKSFNVLYGSGPYTDRLGTLTYSQLLREGYPGAVYYYMALPYRVSSLRYKEGEIHVNREKRYTTQPLLQTMVFPNFQGGLLRIKQSDEAFIIETDLQVSEQVTGFVEQRGGAKSTHEYGVGSPYYQRPIRNFFESTGVCIWFSQPKLLNDVVVAAIRDAFCNVCGVQNRDIGLGIFQSNFSPITNGPCRGMSVYDVSFGSLRLTRQLFERFGEILEFAIEAAETQDSQDVQISNGLREIRILINELQLVSDQGEISVFEKPEGDWINVIAPGNEAVYLTSSGAMESVVVQGYRYTPQGLMYDLVPPKPDVTWMVKASALVPIKGTTEMLRANLMTGETEALAD